jgi:hypothetical protein
VGRGPPVVSRKRVERDWTAALAKCHGEGCCRACGRTIKELRRMGRTLECAHTVGREYDIELADGHRFVHAHSVIPLCGPRTTTDTCHGRQHDHKLDIWLLMSDEEKAWATNRVGYGQARRKTSGRDWT